MCENSTHDDIWPFLIPTIKNKHNIWMCAYAYICESALTRFIAIFSKPRLYFCISEKRMHKSWWLKHWRKWGKCDVIVHHHHHERERKRLHDIVLGRIEKMVEICRSVFSQSFCRHHFFSLWKKKNDLLLHQKSNYSSQAHASHSISGCSRSRFFSVYIHIKITFSRNPFSHP